MSACASVRAFVLVSLLAATPVFAQFCDAYYQFDGNLADASGNGYNGQMIAAGGEPATPNFVEGRSGQALQLSGDSAMRAPLDLHPDSCRQMTVAAWVQIEPEANQMIFGNAGGNRLFNSVSGLSVRTAGRDLWADGSPIRANGGWIFIASVWDYDNEVHRLHWQGRSTEASFAGRAPGNPEAAIWIGTENDRLHNNAKDVVIDEIRFIGRALSTEEVLALRRNGLNPAGTMSQMSAIRDAPAESQIAATGQVVTGIPGPLQTGDQFACQALAGDQFACKLLPGDQFDISTLPGDQFALRSLPGDQFDLSASTQSSRTIGAVPDSLENPNIGAPSGAPELASDQNRTISQVPGSIENQDLSQLPAGAPDPQYDSTAAAEEAARLRAEAEQARSVQDQEQALEPELRPGPVGAPQLSGLSGYTGDEMDMFDLQTEFVYELDWAERNNQPCFIRLNSGQSTGCNTSLTSARRTVSLGSAGVGVGLIEVCSTSNDNRRMKGLRISGDRINADGSTSYLPEDGGDAAMASRDTMPNCSEWHQAVLCPTDTLATGLVLHRNRAGGDIEEIVGLQLICRAVGLN